MVNHGSLQPQNGLWYDMNVVPTIGSVWFISVFGMQGIMVSNEYFIQTQSKINPWLQLAWLTWFHWMKKDWKHLDILILWYTPHSSWSNILAYIYVHMLCHILILCSNNKNPLLRSNIFKIKLFGFLSFYQIIRS